MSDQIKQGRELAEELRNYGDSTLDTSAAEIITRALDRTMPAFSLDLIKRLCLRCRRLATKEVFSGRNELLGYYCTRHATEREREWNATWCPSLPAKEDA